MTTFRVVLDNFWEIMGQLVAEPSHSTLNTERLTQTTNETAILYYKS